MSDISGMGNSTESDKPEAMAQPDSADPSTRNWEERLAIARSEREKNLKAKGKSLSKPVMKRPTFMDDDPSANWALTEPEPEGAREEKIATKSERPVTPDIPVSGTPPSESQNALHSPPAPRGNSISVSWVVIVAFACFFGLGSGIVLSIGAVVSMGWVSLSDLAPKRVISEANTAPRAPAIFTTVFKPLSPPLARAAWISLRYDSIKPLPASQRTPPALLSAYFPDAGLTPVQSPAPQLHTSGVADELVSRLDFQPAAISMTFATPIPVSASPAPFGTSGTSVDLSPEVLEKSDIRLLTQLADLSNPAIEKTVIQLASMEMGLERPLTGPALIKSVPETLPQVSWARLDKPDIFSTAIASFSATDPNTTDALVLASLADGPPERSPRAKAPVHQVQGVSLPVIGTPHVYNPSLATRLGMKPTAVQQVSLVTFAPANVPEETLSSHANVLAATGFPVAKVNRVNFKVSRTHVRYYRNRDETLARALAAEIGGIARNFSTARNRPPSGQIEVWLEGNRKTQRTIASTPRRSVSTAQRQAAAKAQLENRLVNSLRRGEHLGVASR